MSEIAEKDLRRMVTFLTRPGRKSFKKFRRELTHEKGEDYYKLCQSLALTRITGD